MVWSYTGRSWAPGTQGPGPGLAKFNRLQLYSFFCRPGVQPSKQMKAQSLDGLSYEKRTHERGKAAPRSTRTHEAEERFSKKMRERNAVLLLKKSSCGRRRVAHTQDQISRLQRSRRRRCLRPPTPSPLSPCSLAPGRRPLCPVRRSPGRAIPAGCFTASCNTL